MVRIPDVYTPSVNMQVGGSPEVQAGRVVPMQDPTGQMIAQMGQGVSALAEGVMRVENQIDNARTKEAESLLADFAVESLTQYRAAAGKSAVEGYKGVSESLEKRRREAEKLLQNDTQRTMFRMAADRRMRSYQQVMQSHYLEQVKVWDGAQNEARMQQFANEALLARDAALMPTTAENPYMLAKGGMETAIRDQAALMQLPQSQDPASPYQQYRVGKLSELHNTVLKTLIDNKQHAKAQAYLQQVQKSGELAAPALVKHEAAIKDATQNDEAFTQFQQWRAGGLNSAQMAQQLDQQLRDNKVSQEVYDKLEPRIARMERDELRQEQRNIRLTRERVLEEFSKINQQGAEFSAFGDLRPATWDDLPKDVRDAAAATGQDWELRALVNSGGLFQDSQDGLSALRSISADPSGLVNKDWSDIENAFRYQMSNESLGTLAKIHERVNRQHAVELERKAQEAREEVERRAKQDALKTSQAKTMINGLLERVYPEMQYAGERGSQVKALRNMTASELEEVAAGMGTTKEFADYIGKWEQGLLTIQLQDQNVKVSTSRRRQLIDLKVLEPSAPMSFTDIGEDGMPKLVELTEETAPLMQPGTMNKQLIMETQNMSLNQAIAQYNTSNPSAQIQTNADAEYDHGVESGQRYLLHKNQLANELLADPEKRRLWEKTFPGQNIFGPQDGMTKWASMAPTFANAYKMRQRQKEATMFAIKTASAQAIGEPSQADFTASESRGGF